MPPDDQITASSTVSGWQFRLFMLLIGVILAGFIAWLGWSALRYSPTEESDVMKSLLASEIFVVPDILIASGPSDCRTEGFVQGSIDAALFGAYLEANSADAESLALFRYRPRQRFVDDSRDPIQWYWETGNPVASVSRAGIDGDRALVCIDIYAKREQSFLVTMRHVGASAWAIENQTLVWKDDEELPPEELPESNIPEVR